MSCKKTACCFVIQFVFDQCFRAIKERQRRVGPMGMIFIFPPLYGVMDRNKTQATTSTTPTTPATTTTSTVVAAAAQLSGDSNCNSGECVKEKMG
jgi:hypothetical protein